jgi:uncharacterized protein YjbI with pentapeptide repeats
MENTQEIQQLIKALKALRRSTERALHTGATEGVAPIALQGFNRLSQRAREILPDDFYVTDVLAVEITPDAPDETVLAQVNFATEQLGSYLGGLLPDERGPNINIPRPPRPPEVTFGRDLAASIIEATRSGLQRALGAVDLNIELSAGSEVSGVHVPGGNFSGYVLDEITIEGSSFTGASFTEASLRGARLSGVSLQGASFKRADLEAAQLNKTRLTGASLRGASLRGASLHEVDLTGVNLQEADLSEAQFVNCSLAGANLMDADLRGATFENVTLKGVRLPDGSPYEEGVDLSPFTAPQADEPPAV